MNIALMQCCKGAAGWTTQLQATCDRQVRPTQVSLNQSNSLQLQCDHLPALSPVICNPRKCQQAAMLLAAIRWGRLDKAHILSAQPCSSKVSCTRPLPT